MSVNGRAARVIPERHIRTNPLRLACYRPCCHPRRPARRRVWRKMVRSRGAARPAALLVDARVVGHARDDRERASLPPQHVAPERVGCAREHVGGERGHHDPGTAPRARPPAAPGPSPHTRRRRGSHAARRSRMRPRSRRGESRCCRSRSPPPARRRRSRRARLRLAGAQGHRRRRARPGPSSSAIGGTASETSAVETRFSTTPIAPSSPCSPTRTTVRRKLGSTSAGPATSSCPRSECTRPFSPARDTSRAGERRMRSARREPSARTAC